MIKMGMPSVMELMEHTASIEVTQKIILASIAGINVRLKEIEYQVNGLDDSGGIQHDVLDLVETTIEHSSTLETIRRNVDRVGMNLKDLTQLTAPSLIPSRKDKSKKDQS